MSTDEAIPDQILCLTRSEFKLVLAEHVQYFYGIIFSSGIFEYRKEISPTLKTRSRAPSLIASQ